MHPPRLLPTKAFTAPRYTLSFPRHGNLSRPSPIQQRTIRSISRPNFKLIKKAPHMLGASQEAAIQRRIASNTLAVRTGALAIKKGMAAVYDPTTGKRTVCTILQLDRVQVVGHKTRSKHGYDAVMVGYGWQHPGRLSRALLGEYAKRRFEDMTGEQAGIAPKEAVREFQVRGENDPQGRPKLPVGTEIKASWWNLGAFVDVKGVTHGKGFAGVMKRHGFGGQPASHGVSLTHRSMGSSGGSQGSGSRVHPGKKMAGRMGHENHTVQNLRVVSVDDETGIIAVSGPVPGPKKSLVRIVDSVKKPWPEVSEYEKEALVRPAKGGSQMPDLSQVADAGISQPVAATP